MKNGISVFIFAYNEEEFIVQTCKRLEAILEKVNLNYEIIVLDDCSTDNTSKNFLTEFSDKEKFRIISINRNTGLSGLIKLSLGHANYNRLTYFPGDDSFLSKNLDNFFLRSADHDLVIGVRKNTEVFNIKRKVLSKFNNLMISFLCLKRLGDAHGLQIHSKNNLSKVSFFGIRYDCWVEILPTIFMNAKLKYCEEDIFVNQETLFKSNTLSSGTVKNFAVVWIKMFLKRFLNFKF